MTRMEQLLKGLVLSMLNNLLHLRLLDCIVLHLTLNVPRAYVFCQTLHFDGL